MSAPPLRGPALFSQQWRDLTFMHWSIDPDLVAPLLPRGTVPDVLDGKTYVGLVPFHMRHAGLGSRFATPWLGDFPETNVRLYSVDGEGRHGVVFLSLESARLLTTMAARWGYGIPYVWSKMRIGRRGTRLRYISKRRWPQRGLWNSVTVEVGPKLPVDEQPELMVFLTARWGLHSTLAGRTIWTPNWHQRWPLHTAELLRLDDQLTGAAGVRVAGPPDVPTLWSGGVHTYFGFPQLI